MTTLDRIIDRELNRQADNYWDTDDKDDPTCAIDEDIIYENYRDEKEADS